MDIGADNSTQGLISQADDLDQPAYTPRTANIPYYFYGKYFGDKMVNSSATGTGVGVYSSTFSDGEAGMVNINSTDQYVKLNMNSTKFDNSKAYLHEYYATDLVDGNTKFYINGQTDTTVGGGPTNYATIPPYQATFTNNSILKVKRYSVVYLNLSLPASTGLMPIVDNNKSTFSITPNPASDYVCIKRQESTEAKVEIRNMMEKKVYADNLTASNITISSNNIGAKGVYFVYVNSEVKKLILK
jgi:hypothetical protein